jgi:GR25 family glycosyltransferase involved in LPS biosynthesis
MRDIPVYVISLRDAEVRRHNMTERLGALAIPFQFVDAIDGRTQRLPDRFDGARVKRSGFWGESALACTLSHRTVHRMIAEAESDLALVLEDDAKPSEDFAKVLDATKELDFDVFKFEGGRRGRCVSVGAIGTYSIVVGMTPSMASAAYLLTRTAAQRFCNLRILDQMIDETFGDPRLALKVLELDPFAVTQDRETPTMVDLQSYGSEPIQYRRGTLGRLAHSFRKRARVAMALELQRLAGTRRPQL